MREVNVFAIVTVCAAVCLAVPQTKLFHEHVRDFVGVVIAEVGLQLEYLMRQYSESEDFGFACVYLTTTNFKKLFDELQTLPEFKAIVEYLEKSHIDVSHYIEKINNAIEGNEKTRHKFRKLKQNEMAASSFMRDAFGLLPKKKLTTLLEEKKNESPNFREAIEKLNSEEFARLHSALWESTEFKRIVHTLEENGLDVRLLIDQVKSAFGQS